MKQFNGSRFEWNEIISNLPGTHILQTWEWSQAKAEYGWESYPFYWESTDPSNYESNPIYAAAMILKRRIPIRGFSSRLCVLYSPRGPVLDWKNHSHRSEVLNDIQSFARNQDSIFLKIDPGITIDPESEEDKNQTEKPLADIFKKELIDRGWIFSQDQVQFRNTAVIDLKESEEKILASFKQKTRYNVKLAVKKDITVRKGSMNDLNTLFEMYAETSIRDGFVIRDKHYYLTIWEKFIQNKDNNGNPSATPLIAEFEGNPVAAILVFNFGGNAYYLYGMSRDKHREKMPNHLLQWEAIKFAKSIGCTSYDLWGAPDEINDKDPMWGVYRFKVGLGAKLVRTPGAWDFPSKPAWYKIYTQIIPKILNLMRKRGRSQTKRSLSLN